LVDSLPWKNRGDYLAKFKGGYTDLPWTEKEKKDFWGGKHGKRLWAHILQTRGGDGPIHDLNLRRG